MQTSALAKLIVLTLGMGAASLALAQTAQLNSLRGSEVDEPVVLDQMHKQVERRIQRNYRQQPPLIPHAIAQYQVDLRANQCLTCHDWTKAGERNAPTLSMTHYLDRDGNELDHVAGTRYFCTQCHVPQVDAPALVENLFRPSNSR